MTCPACQHAIPKTNRFCGKCGLAVALNSTDFTPQNNVLANQVHLGWRYVTTLFTDIVGSTELIKKFGPEALQRILQVYQRQSERIINDYGGCVIEVQGDGIVAIFSGEENAAERAVRAGYDLVRSILQLCSFGSGARQTKLQTRIGIATDEALVSVLIDKQHRVQVLGTPNYLAARLQNFAQVNQVVVCPETHRHSSDFFGYTPLNNFRLKGFAEVDEVWQLRRANDSHIRFSMRHPVLTPLVGRDAIIINLLKLWDKTLAKCGQVVILRGQAGIGKSHVAAEFIQQVQRRSPAHIKLRYQCSLFAKNIPLYPVMQQITTATNIKHDREATMATKLISILDSWRGHKQPHKDSLMPLARNIQNARQNCAELSTAQINAAIKTCACLPIYFTARAPVLALIEDVHFSDEASKSLLMQSIKQAKQYRIMIVVTTRREFASLDSKEDYISEIPLKRLAKYKDLELLQNIKFGNQLPDKIRREILDKSDGVPLYIEELTLHIGGRLAKSSGERPPSIKTPAVLFDLFIAHFDRYPENIQMITRAAAAMGKEFDHRILAFVLNKPAASVSDAINMLVQNKHVYQSATKANHFTFKHALLRDAIYDNTLNRFKYQLHKGIVNYLKNPCRWQSIATIIEINHHQKMSERYAEYGDDEA